MATAVQLVLEFRLRRGGAITLTFCQQYTKLQKSMQPGVTIASLVIGSLGLILSAGEAWSHQGNETLQTFVIASAIILASGVIAATLAKR